MMAVEWALAELLRNPETVKQALSELDTIVGRDHIVEESDLKQFGYLEAIVKEILHLHPPLPIVFHASHETEWQVIQGYSLPPVIGLCVNVWAIGHDPNAWEKPWEFNPQRFIQNKKIIDVTGQCFELLPWKWKTSMSRTLVLQPSNSNHLGTYAPKLQLVSQEWAEATEH
ncbi:unnamed protein product [Sphagnum jensenii]|jgi:cytochrome P450|uniref:Cytochrome P450 n=1 Tax=Sphagnum jensenii TaxID=128206 RepID=A0ABP0VX55_9BRYO